MSSQSFRMPFWTWELNGFEPRPHSAGEAQEIIGSEPFVPPADWASLPYADISYPEESRQGSHPFRGFFPGIID